MSNMKKTYYSISEVCARTNLEPHVLRYWESEFPQLHPKKNRAGNRAYRDKDIGIIEQIKHLLYEEQFTIPGAKIKLAAARNNHEEPQSPSSGQIPSGGAPDIIKKTAEDLRDVLSLLAS